MMRYFAGISDDMRQKFRDTVINATPKIIKECLEEYFTSEANTEAVAVYSAREKLDEANKQLTKKLLLENLLE